MKIIEFKTLKIEELGVEVSCYNIEGEDLFIGKEVCDLLGYPQNSKPLRKKVGSKGNVNEEYKKTKYIKTVDGLVINNNMTLITKDGFVQLVAKSQKIDGKLKKSILSNLGVDGVVVNTRIEIEFLSFLEKHLDELNIKGVKQFNVDGYRVDFYIPELNIAIEYDEQQHYTEINSQLDLERQKYIENKLGCKFIRCDYRDSDIKNVMKVLKEVM